MNYNKIDSIQSKRGGVKNMTCTFCDAAFTGCSRAFAHILQNAVIGPKRSNIGAFVPICQGGYNHCAQFKNAQRILNKEMIAKGQLLSSPQSKRYILNMTLLTSLTSPGNRTVSGEMNIVKSKRLDSAVSNFMYENALSFHVADMQNLALASYLHAAT